MKIYQLMMAVAAASLAASGALAADVLYDELPNVNTSSILQNFTTTTDPTTGRVITVTKGTYNAPTATNKWRPASVTGGASVGITMDNTNDGDGAVYFATNNTKASKADLVYNFSQPVALSSLQSISYEWYIDSASTSDLVHYSPVLRLNVSKNGFSAGTLVFEAAYNGGFGAEDVWTLNSATLTSGIWWATSLGKDIYNRTLQDWLNAYSNDTLTVTGISIGVGSGWEHGTTITAVDHVAFNFTGGPTGDFNFKVIDLPQAAVPEPASWALMIGGFALMGGALRSQRRRLRFA